VTAGRYTRKKKKDLIRGYCLTVRKGKKMRHSHTTAQRDKVEKELIAWIEAKPTQELSQFLAGPWTASLLSPEAIEELYRYRERRQKEEAQREDFQWLFEV
jgi:hypothetical protein